MDGALQGGDPRGQFVEPLLQIVQHLLRVIIRARARTLGVGFGLRHDCRRARLRGLDHFAQVGLMRGFVFSHLHDAVRFFFGLREDAVFFLRHAARLFDFFRHRNPQLVNDVETFVLVNHALVAERHGSAFIDGCFEPVNQIKNVYGDQPLSSHRMTRGCAEISDAHGTTILLQIARNDNRRAARVAQTKCLAV